jgi:hypothetical protein
MKFPKIKTKCHICKTKLTAETPDEIFLNTNIPIDEPYYCVLCHDCNTFTEIPQIYKSRVDKYRAKTCYKFILCKDYMLNIYDELYSKYI